MSKTIPIALQTHKNQTATTLAQLLRIGPAADGTIIGLTTLDRDIVYNDGAGAITYRAHTGMDPSAQMASADLAVDNAEVTTLQAVGIVPGITEDMVERGLFDKAPFALYEVNYSNLSQGHEVIATGTVGEQTIRAGGAVLLELRSLSQQAKQSVVELDSLTCRVKQFGSQVGDERFPCLYDITGEWVDFTVTSVLGEVTREFRSSDILDGDDYFSPGLVEWQTGENAGQQVEVEAHAQVIGAPSLTEVTSGIIFTQSSVYGAGLTATATNMRDGLSNTGGATTASGNEWFRADLGVAKTIGRVAVAGGNLPGWGGVASYLNGRTIEWSNDGTTWTTVATISGVDDTGALFNFDFTAISARYWRVKGVNWSAITEFRIYESVAGGVIGGDVTLQFTLPSPISVGDTGRIRRECTRQWEGHNSCQTYHGSSRGLRFRGEPFIPVGDPVMAPGAEQ